MEVRRTPKRATRVWETDSTIQRSRMMDDPRVLLRQAGLALFGDIWQSALAQALGVDVRSVRRWTSGEHQPHSGVWRDIRDLAQQRKQQLVAVIAQLPTGEN